MLLYSNKLLGVSHQHIQFFLRLLEERLQILYLTLGTNEKRHSLVNLLRADIQHPLRPSRAFASGLKINEQV